MANYKLMMIKYSPKKLRQLSRLLRGDVYNILFFLRYCDKVKIAGVLTKFFVSVYRDVHTKFGTSKRMFVSECHVGRADVVKQVWFLARGKLAWRRSRRSNLSVSVVVV
ncbi:uL22 family ribosomal protein [Candidatus Hodgkinia cicadicola]